MKFERRKSIKTAEGAYIETYAYNPVFEGLQFKTPEGTPFNGELSRVFDIDDNVPTDEAFNQEMAINGIFRFLDGYLHAEGMPAVEYPGHKEFWSHGSLQSVSAGYGAVEEEWYKGMLVSIDIKEPDACK